jgi:mRNA interferase RelE/StbE
LSARYRVFETDELLKQLKRLDASSRQFLQGKLTHQIYPQLREEPHFGRNIKRLHDYDPPTWRYRVGRFRVFFGIDEEASLVLVLTIAQRKDAYR